MILDYNQMYRVAFLLVLIEKHKYQQSRPLLIHTFIYIGTSCTAPRPLSDWKNLACGHHGPYLVHRLAHYLWSISSSGTWLYSLHLPVGCTQSFGWLVTCGKANEDERCSLQGAVHFQGSLMASMIQAPENCHCSI